MQFLVTWKINIEAESSEDAAKEALKIQRDSESIATVFEVTFPDGTIEKVDLDNIED